MSTQNANESKQINADEKEEIIEKYRKNMAECEKHLVMLAVAYMTEKFITSYKHIGLNEYADFDNFINKYNTLFYDLSLVYNFRFSVSYAYLNLDIITKYIAENFNRNIVLNWIYRNIFEDVYELRGSYEGAELMMIYTCPDCYPFSLFDGLILSLIKFYMPTSDDENNENDLKIIQNYFPGFGYSGNENIHKIFWESEIDDIYECSDADSWKEIIHKYEYECGYQCNSKYKQMTTKNANSNE